MCAEREASALAPELRATLDALLGRLIPQDETPGAREAGVLDFLPTARTC